MDIRKALPKNYAKELAAEFNMSPGCIYKHAKGIITHTTIRMRLVEMAEDEQVLRRNLKAKEKLLVIEQ